MKEAETQIVPSRIRRTWLVCGCFGGLLFAAGLWFLLMRTDRRSPLSRLDHDIPRYHWSPDHVVLEHDGKRISFIQNDLLRRPVWDVTEAKILVDAVRAGYRRAERDLDPIPTIAERSERIVFRFTMNAITGRLEYGAPITAPARQMLIGLLIEELDDSFPERRRSAAATLINRGEIENPVIRVAVERLLDDPDPDTVEHIGFLLTRYDDEKLRRAKRAGV
ncbi:MAG: hypothetical protein JNK58_01980 [Phycisphaerae bacterium]|nr:hypothetical protein [Phycisphaerae bacterium]